MPKTCRHLNISKNELRSAGLHNSPLIGDKGIWSLPFNKNPRFLPLTLTECWSNHSVLLSVNCAVLWHLKINVEKVKLYAYI